MPESFGVENPGTGGALRPNTCSPVKILGVVSIAGIVGAAGWIIVSWATAPPAPPESTTTTTAGTTSTTTITTSTSTSTTSTEFTFPPPLPKPASAPQIMKGIAYAPDPLKELGAVPNDDFFCDETESLWGVGGRKDLLIMKRMGAKTVRLYGNDPRYSHGEFLDAAEFLKMDVVPGFSDWPYTQAPDNCAFHKGFDCFKHIKDQYTMMLHDGKFLKEGGAEYHTSIREIVLINEPDRKLPGGLHNVEGWSKAVISAFDGALEAEKEAGVSGEVDELPKFTVSFSYAECGPACGSYGSSPALGQMVELHRAMLDPSSVGYTARNDLATAFEERFTNSFNTQNPARDIEPQFLGGYLEHFGYKPVYIAEFHKPGWDTYEDMKQILDIAADETNPLVGAIFFEFQVRYDKGDSEMEFGMFGLGHEVMGQVPLGDWGKAFDIYCLTEQWDSAAGMSMPAAIAKAFGGSPPKAEWLCPSTETTTTTTRTTTTTTTSTTTTTLETDAWLV